MRDIFVMLLTIFCILILINMVIVFKSIPYRCVPIYKTPKRPPEEGE